MVTLSIILHVFFINYLTLFFFGLDKDRKLAEVTAECKALKLAERLREKAVEEVSSVCVLLYRRHFGHTQRLVLLRFLCATFTSKSDEVIRNFAKKLVIVAADSTAGCILPRAV